jgi:hypothetical protein
MNTNYFVFDCSDIKDFNIETLKGITHLCILQSCDVLETLHLCDGNLYNIYTQQTKRINTFLQNIPNTVTHIMFNRIFEYTFNLSYLPSSVLFMYYVDCDKINDDINNNPPNTLKHIKCCRCGGELQLNNKYLKQISITKGKRFKNTTLMKFGLASSLVE